MEKAYMARGNVVTDVENSEVSVADDASYKHTDREMRI
jgi:hypothetical protein